MDSLQNRFSIALQKTSRAWRMNLERRLKCHGLSQAAWLAVAAVVTAKQTPSQTDLAKYLGVEGATMVPMIDRLVIAGLVRRELSHVDRRVKLVMITSAGLELYKQVEIEMELMHRELLAKIDKNDLSKATETLQMVQRIAEFFP